MSLYYRHFVVLCLCSWLQSCSSMSLHSELLSKKNYAPSDFEGVYLPKERMNHVQSKTFGNKITITDFVPDDIASHLLSNPADLTKSKKSLSVAISREDEQDQTSKGVAKYYYLGINEGPVDLIHYDFDDERNAFERTTTTLKGNLLTHRRDVLIYKKGDVKKTTKSAGFSVTHSFQIFGKHLVITQNVNQLEAPWVDVFPPTGDIIRGGITATFLKVNEVKRQASLGPYVARTSL